MLTRMVRRVAALTLLTSLPLAVGCGGGGGSSSPSSPSSPSKPQSVTTTFSFYNAATGPVGSFTQTAEVGAKVTIDVNTAGVKGVDPNFIVAREPSTSELGAYITETTNGTLTYTMSASRANVHVWFFENTNGENYECLYQSSTTPDVSQGVGKALVTGKRNVTARPFRPDEVPYPGFVLTDGPPSVWTGVGPDGVPGAIDQIQAAMNPFGIRYYSIDILDAGSRADISFGFGSPSDGSGDGWHSVNWAIVNLGNVSSFRGQRHVAISEFSEVMAQVQNPCGFGFGYWLASQGVLTPAGKNILRWASIFTPK